MFDSLRRGARQQRLTGAVASKVQDPTGSRVPQLVSQCSEDLLDEHDLALLRNHPWHKTSLACERQSAALRAQWRKIGRASRVAGQMHIRKLEAALQRVETDLSNAEVELRRRKSVLLEVEATPLPPDWQAVLDPSGSGQHYYFHEVTGETRWDRPVGSLPAGWVTVSHPESGGEYYYHPESGKTSWTRPVDAEDAMDDGGSATSVPTTAAEDVSARPLVPLWRAIGVPEARASARQDDLDAIEAAVEAGDFEKAIELREKLREWSASRGLRSQRL